MDSIFVGSGYVALFIRGAKTLKDRRSVIQSAVQKLKNEGFSVAEMDFGEDPQRTAVAFTFVGKSFAFVENKFDEALRVFNGPYYIVSKKKEIFQWEMDEEEGFKNAEDEIYE